jgi:hypothetical protein
MAPWIKMRTDLRRHPKVVMASALGADRYRVIGGLLAVWAVFDEQTEDGFLEGYTPDAMDVEIGWAGFCAAMMSVAWLSFQEHEGLAVPEFDEHNGQSAKRRASDTKRKRDERESEEPPQPVRPVSASRADKKTTRGREEEDKKKHPPTPKGADAAFEKFWAAYPKKVGKDAARKAFGKRDAALVGQMVQAMKRTYVASSRPTARARPAHLRGVLGHHRERMGAQHRGLGLARAAGPWAGGGGPDAQQVPPVPTGGRMNGRTLRVPGAPDGLRSDGRSDLCEVGGPEVRADRPIPADRTGGGAGRGDRPAHTSLAQFHAEFPTLTRTEQSVMPWDHAAGEAA